MTFKHVPTMDKPRLRDVKRGSIVFKAIAEDSFMAPGDRRINGRHNAENAADSLHKMTRGRW